MGSKRWLKGTAKHKACKGDTLVMRSETKKKRHLEKKTKGVREGGPSVARSPNLS